MQNSGISSFFEDYLDIGEPIELHQNKDQMFQGSIFLGDGFLLSYQERDMLVAADPKNAEVIFPVINGREVNNDPEQRPGRCIINFFDWPEELADQYHESFDVVRREVHPVRLAQKDKGAKEKWWQYIRPRTELYKSLQKLGQCFVTAATTKHLSFSPSPVDRVFTHALFVYVNDKFSKIAILQSTLHNEWARKYSGALKLDLRYSPSNCFVTFPFPQKLSDEMETELERLGEEYHEFRQKLMLKIKLGLTKTYNQLHNPDLREFSNDDIPTISTLKAKEFQKQYGKETINLWKHIEKTEGTCTFNQAVRDILHLRELHKQMDETVLNAYGWQDINLAPDFYEVDYLPENDRVRYTISHDARKEVLKRLLKLNHEIHEQEMKASLHIKGKAKKKQKADASKQIKLF